MRWIITNDLIGTNSHGVGDDENGGIAESVRKRTLSHILCGA